MGGGAAGIARAVNDGKADRQQLKEQKRHYLALEAAGKGLYLKPFKGYGLYLAYPEKLPVKLPHHPVTNLDLKYYANKLKISYFRRFFMKDNFPKKIKKKEIEIVNLDTSSGSGTHWVAYDKKKKKLK